MRINPARTFLSSLLVLTCSLASAADRPLIRDGMRVVFLGDSNTFAAHYVNLIECQLMRARPDWRVDIINVGLPSETACGLSEPDHPWPRPDVHERLERVLKRLNPDLVVACYGMNDGIYHPFSDERFRTYQSGIRRLIEKVRSSGAPLVLLTPPPFDPEPQRRDGKIAAANAEKFAWFSIYEGYDEVMQRYARWIGTLNDEVERVVDIRTPMLAFQAERRKDDPEFSMSGDGVHFDHTGHEVIARTLLPVLGIPDSGPVPAELERLVAKRQQILRDAWLTETRHQRPGVKPGLPIEQALDQADQLEVEIRGKIPGPSAQP